MWYSLVLMHALGALDHSESRACGESGLLSTINPVEHFEILSDRAGLLPHLVGRLPQFVGCLPHLLKVAAHCIETQLQSFENTPGRSELKDVEPIDLGAGLILDAAVLHGLADGVHEFRGYLGLGALVVSAH